jgi:hypothetical protein
MSRMDPDLAAVVKVIEESFGVEFNGGEIDRNSTLSDISAVLRARIGGPAPHGCFTSIVFWRLRRAFVEILGVPKRSIRSWTSVEELVRPSQRRRIWRAVGDAACLKVPGLEYGHVCASAIFWAAFIPFGLALLSRRSGWWVAASLAAFPIIIATLLRALKPFANSLPDHCLTVGDLARTVVGLNHAGLVRQFGPSAEREFRDALRYVVADVTGAEPESLREYTRLSDLVEEIPLRVPVLPNKNVD